MEKLKTLKDIAKEFNAEHLLNDDSYHFGRLKQEAIKWIKEDKWSLEGSFATCDTHVAELFLERWMKRFNITDKDLK